MKMQSSNLISTDLHIHSCWSIDGEYECRELIQLAKKAGIRTTALCDHNCMQGIDTMREEGKINGIHVLPAIEFDSLFHGYETHIIGYGLHYHAPVFEHLHERINQLEYAAFRNKAKRLQELYQVDMELDELMIKCREENPFQVIYGTFLSNVREKNIRKFHPYYGDGERSNNAVVNFYWDYCSYGKEAFVPVPYPHAEAVIQQIHEYSGIAVLAHPGVAFYERTSLLDELCQMGIDGIEVFTTYHDEAQRQFFKDCACRNHLLISGGSDFHGSYKPHICMGEYGMCKEDEQLLMPLIDVVENL